MIKRQGTDYNMAYYREGSLEMARDPSPQGRGAYYREGSLEI